ncbi:MAG TPA: glycosyltransferase [Roseiflexaceae bacterium]|nr:glycosyltransferase [Roseiflexaceae bacterium]
MERILILHASVGTGHKSAAQALAEAFSRNPERVVQVEDTLSYGNPLFREAYVRSYLELSDKAPLLWKLFYETADTDDLELALTSNRVRGLAERPLVSKLDKLVRGFAPSALVCTHPLPIEVLQHLKLNGKLRAPIYCVVTDYVAHSIWMNSAIDRYFLASEPTRQELLARGVPASVMHVSGIPIKPEIAEPKPAAEMRARHNLPADAPVITLFGGGLDPRRVRMMVARLLDIPADGMLLVVAGRSATLEHALAGMGDGPRMHLQKFGFIPYVDDLVAASDLVITKSGGLIVSEVLARGTPMIIVDPIPGQEEWNADFVAGMGAGIQLRMPETVPHAVLDMLAQPERLALMRTQALRVGRPRAAQDIVDIVLHDLRTGVNS